MSLAKKQVFVQETFDTYNNSEIKKFIELEMRKNSKKWIYEVLEGVKEKNEIVLDNEHYVFLPNNFPNIRKYPHPAYLNMLIIFKDKNLKSLRDLKGKHISLLEETMQNCLMLIQNIYSIERENIIAYFHYPPSVYQLHLHIVTKQYCRVGDLYRFHNVYTVISNLKLDPDYYSKINLHFSINKNSNLYFAIQKSYLNDEPDNIRHSLHYAYSTQVASRKIPQTTEQEQESISSPTSSSSEVSKES